MDVKYSLGILLFVIISLGVYFTYNVPSQFLPEENLTTAEKIKEAKDQVASRADQIRFENAQILNNRNYCNQIVDEELRELCLELVEGEGSNYEPKGADNIRFENAKSENNEVYCYSIEDNELKQECIKEVTGEEVEIVDEASPSDKYYYDMAIKRGRISMCESINSNNLKQECINELQ